MRLNEDLKWTAFRIAVNNSATDSFRVVLKSAILVNNLLMKM
jgi:hypothetical protein